MTAKFIDVHAHLNDREFDGIRDNLLSSLSKEYMVLNAGENAEESRRILEEGKKHSFLLPCIGLHPNEIAGSSYDKAQEEFIFFSENIGRFFAVSEVGLDYKGKDIYQMQQEKEFFYRILEASSRGGKACIIHSRKAVEDVLDAVSSFNVKAVIHNFEGNLRSLRRAEELGTGISISTGFMKFRKDNVIREVSLDRLFTETDSPVLSPDDGINTPLNIPKLLNYISGIKKIKMEELKSAVYGNFVRMFYA